MTRTPRSCPICGKPRDDAFAPFCSSHCRDRDLLQWLNGAYALPGPSLDPATDSPLFDPDADPDAVPGFRHEEGDEA